MLFSSHDFEIKSDPVRWSCSVCKKGVEVTECIVYSINWVHKQCSGLKRKLPKSRYSFKFFLISVTTLFQIFCPGL